MGGSTQAGGWRLAHRPVGFVSHESNCSFLWRVAAAQGVEVDFLLAELGEGPPGQQALRPHIAEVFFSSAAAGRLAAMCGMERQRLQWPLPHLREPHLLPGDQARWQWPWAPREHYLLPACGLCVAARGGGCGWLVWPDRWKVCRRHRRFTHLRHTPAAESARPAGVDLTPLPEVLRAHHQRGRLEQGFGPAGAAVVADGFAIAGWWWRQDIFARVWIDRAQRARLAPQDAETAALLVYPEAMQVARALLRYEQQRAAQPTGPWPAAEARLLSQTRALAAVLGLSPGAGQVPVTEWLLHHQRCRPPAEVDAGAGGRRRVRQPVTAVIHLGDDDGAAGSLEGRCCLPWDFSDPSSLV